MIVSYNWLQKYFDENLPSPEAIADALTFYVFEIEEMKKVGDDTILDIKILPDRAHYALSHRGIAKEISAILNIPLKNFDLPDTPSANLKKLEINIEDENSCPRYIGRRIENITVSGSPSWLKEKMEIIGQRSINSIVDIANYVMLDMGQPLHMFDADKVEGSINVRFAREGEKITTLDDKEINLDPNILIIADDEGPLAIAGIKGGKKAEVTRETKNLIIESANFNPTLIRKTSGKVGIKGEASKRYENEITSEYALIGMNEVSALIKEMNPEAKAGEIVDVYPKRSGKRKIEVSPEAINKILGIKVPEKEIVTILGRLNIEVEENENGFRLEIPDERLDIKFTQDIAEEVGRLYGYEKVPAQLSDFLKTRDKSKEKTNVNLYWMEKIKDILIDMEFSEVFTSSLASKGYFEIEKSASDKNFLRSNLSENLQKSLELNLYNAPLLGLDQIKIFEIGKVFPESGEHLSICIGIANTKNHKRENANERIRQVRENLLEIIQSKMTTACTIDDNGGILILNNKPIGKINEIEGIMEFNLDEFIKNLGDLPDDTITMAKFDRDNTGKANEKKYKPISSYPFVLRDIAVFVPTPDQTEKSLKEKESEVSNIIQENGTDLLVRADLFDTFTKTFKDTGEVKTSYGFRLVFQAQDRTLTDQEINEIMVKIAAEMGKNQGWQVR